MLKLNGADFPAPSAMKVAVFDVSSGVNRNAAGGAVMDCIAVKRRLELKWAYLPGADMAKLLDGVNGFFRAEYPDPATGTMRAMDCYCSERVTGVLRMDGGTPVWTDVEMTWTER